jgi:hypothetical protein
VKLNFEIYDAHANQTLQWINSLGLLCLKLLNMQRHVEGEPWGFIREACRLVLLLFLAPVRRHLAGTTFTTAMQSEKLAVVVSERRAD